METVTMRAVSAEEGSEIASVRAGDKASQRILNYSGPDGLAFTFSRTTHLGTADPYRTPRHHHSFQQIRWAERGPLNFAPGRNIAEGDLAYFPKAAFYGPQLLEESTSITCQFGFNGEKQHGVAAWDSYRHQAMDILRARGVFEDGVYRETDEATGQVHERDSMEALYDVQYELATGRKLPPIPPEGYDGPVLMHPLAFEYFEVSAGIEVRRLGRFFDHAGPNADLRLSMVRLSPPGVHRLGTDRAQLLFSITPGLRVGAEHYPEFTCVFVPRDEVAELSAADSTVELHQVDFPRLD